MLGQVKRLLRWIQLMGVAGLIVVAILSLGFSYAEQEPDSPVPGKVTGAVFNDLNKNGLREAGEPLLTGWTISLYGSDGITLLAQEVTVEGGQYNFGGLTPAKYFVEVKLLGPEWENTTPVKQAGTLLYQNGESFNPLVDFGIAQAALPFIPSPAPASEKPSVQPVPSGGGVLPYTGAESEEKPLRPAILWAALGFALIAAGLGFVSEKANHKN